MPVQLINTETPALSFLIIGAQKSATTSLARYLAAHPSIFLPGGKELEFFSDPLRYGKGMPWLISEFFGEARDGQLKGEASTHYMMYPETAGRISATLPDVRLISILRNPIDRAYSHYRMSCMRGRESRSFEKAVLEDIDSSSLLIDENYNYVKFGEYSRILNGYLKFFDTSQIKLLFTEDLERDPIAVVQDVFKFLGVDLYFVPPNLEQRYNTTGKKLVPGLDAVFRRGLRWARRQRPFKEMLSLARYSELVFWSQTQFNIRPTEGEGVPYRVRGLLKGHYAESVARLQQDFGVSVPWPEFRGASPGSAPTQTDPGQVHNVWGAK